MRHGAKRLVPFERPRPGAPEFRVQKADIERDVMPDDNPVADELPELFGNIVECGQPFHIAVPDAVNRGDASWNGNARIDRDFHRLVFPGNELPVEPGEIHKNHTDRDDSAGRGRKARGFDIDNGGPG